MEIRNWITDEVLYQDKANTIKELVEKSVKEGVSLKYADFNGANLRYAHLKGADLSGANLRGADLGDANLGDANLKGADLTGADLYGADLSGADLYGADLSGADLYGADLSWVNLGGAYIRDANLTCAKNVPENLPMACPKEGSFVGWKKVKNKLVKLEIPEDARRSSATSDKCRCDKAKVLEITDLDGVNQIDEIINNNFCDTIYRVGEMVYPDSFDDDRWDECSHGIHFFMDKQDAINY